MAPWDSEQEQGAPAPDEKVSPRRRWGLAAAAAAGSILLAAITAFASGFGARIADQLDSSSEPLLSYSVEEIKGSCIGGTFLSGQSMSEVLGRHPPRDWDEIERLPGAAMGPPDVVEVSVQGESARKITLTGIDFEVSHRERPVGAIFREPCGGPIVGRALEVDLDASPPRIVESSAETNGLLGSRTASGRPLTRQIRFPWTVSLTDPLLLYVIGTTKACYCEWRAEIPWASGSERGSIQIDDQGQAYRVASGDGLRSYTSTGTRWVGYPPD